MTIQHGGYEHNLTTNSSEHAYSAYHRDSSCQIHQRKKEAPVCVACNAVITAKHVLIECADLLEIRKKCFEEKSLYSLFRNAIPEIIFDFLREIGVFYKI